MQDDRGPRGGLTTRTSTGLTKKNFWLPLRLAEELRRRAYEERCAESELIRRGIELVLAEPMEGTGVTGAGNGNT